MAALVIRGAVRNCGPPLRFSPLLMTTSFVRDPTIIAIGRMPENHPLRVIRGADHSPTI